MNTGQLSEHEEIERLLPWYVTGKLDRADMQRVEAYLAKHPELQARLRLSKAERGETVYLNAPETAPSQETVERFMARLGADRLKAPITERMNTAKAEPFGGWIKRYLFDPFFGAGRPQWGAVAAALVIIAQAAVILSLIVTEPDGNYGLAGGPQTVAEGTTVDVRFAGNASVSQISAALAELNMTIIGGPKANGFFTVRIGASNMSDTEKAERMDALRERSDLVRFVTAPK